MANYHSGIALLAELWGDGRSFCGDKMSPLPVLQSLTSLR